MPRSSLEDVIAAKSIFAGVAICLVIGTILLANAHPQSIWGIAKGVLGITLILAALFGARSAWRTL